MLCADGNRSATVNTVAGLDSAGNGKPSFSKATVVLQSRYQLPTFTRTPPPPASSLVIGMPQFNQKCDESTAERKAARCAAEAMAHLSVLPLAAMSLPPTVSASVDPQLSVALASTAELEHRGSPLAAVSSGCTVAVDVEQSGATDALSSHTDKYSSYDRHFKKKFFGSERRPQSNEPVTKIGDLDHAAGDSGRDGNTSSPEVTNLVACRKAHLAELDGSTISRLCTNVRDATPPVSMAPTPPLPASASSVSHQSRPSSATQLPADDTSRASPNPGLTATPAFSVAIVDSGVGLTSSAGETLAPISHAEPVLVGTAQSTSDSVSSQPTNSLSGQITDEQIITTKTSST